MIETVQFGLYKKQITVNLLNIKLNDIKPPSTLELSASITVIVQLSFSRDFYIYKFSCTQKFDSYRVQAEICRNLTSTLQKACSYTCAEVLIGHAWLPYLSEAQGQLCTHLYPPILQSNKYRKQEPSNRIILRKNMSSSI